MRLIIAGAGKVAGSMTKALAAAGHEVLMVYSRTEEHASELALSVGASWTTSVDDFPEGADACISMLTDEVLPSLAPQIVSAAGPGTLYLHTAGSLPMSLWKDAGAVRYGVLYPMQTFTPGCRVEWDSVPLFIESEDGCRSLVEELAASLSGNVKYLTTQERCRLHMCAVFVSNFPNHMYAIADRMLSAMGVPFSVMLPLVDMTAAKVHTMCPAQCQTGPAVRGDGKVMRLHMEMLEGNPEWQELYRLISEDIIKNRI